MAKIKNKYNKSKLKVRTGAKIRRMAHFAGYFFVLDVQ